MNSHDAFGIHAKAMNTTMCHRAKSAFIPSDNAASNISVFDLVTNQGDRVVYAGL